jgi:CRISPR-associated protein Cmr1
LRESHYAWVLGLPRELGKTRKTGYVLESKNITRRASPVIVAYHEPENVFSEGAYVTILVSGDWPTRLTWIGAGRRQIEINVDNLIDAYRVAFNELSNYLAKLNASMQTIWPR